MERGRAPGKDRGAALILVLWVLALLSLMAAGFLGDTRSESLTTRARADAAAAEALADAGIYWTVDRLLQREELGLDAAGLPADGRPVDASLLGGTVTVRLQDVAGLVDLNGADADLLAGLFRAVGADARQAEALAARVIDFRDVDQAPRPDGMEDADYLAAGLPYGAKDDLFAAVDELLQVPGIDRPLFEALAPHVTVFSGARGIDPRVATPTVLLALPGMAPADVAGFLALRQTQPDVPPPTATGPIVASPGTGFRITVQAREAGGGVFVREAVVRLLGGAQPYVLQSWRQAEAWSPAAPDR